jgi:hypothetical protein
MMMYSAPTVLDVVEGHLKTIHTLLGPVFDSTAGIPSWPLRLQRYNALVLSTGKVIVRELVVHRCKSLERFD